MDSIFIKKIFRQDLQDFSGFDFYSHRFPEESDETQSAFGRIINFTGCQNYVLQVAYAMFRINLMNLKIFPAKPD